ncbi:leishmanolysin-like peptidase, partial [Clonorchis sinensis]
MAVPCRHRTEIRRFLDSPLTDVVMVVDGLDVQICKQRDVKAYIYYVQVSRRNIAGTTSFIVLSKGLRPHEVTNATFMDIQVVRKKLEVAEHVTHVTSEALSVGSLRITPYYTLAFENTAQSEALKTQFIEPAIAYWSEALEAKSPINNVLSFARQCDGGLSQKEVDTDGVERNFCTRGCKAKTLCYTEPIPDEYLDQCREIINGSPQRTGYAGAGLSNTDMLILVDASVTTNCNGVVLAYATTCQLEIKLDRPVLGYINLCPSSIGFNYPDSRILYSAILHELGHALGFSSLLYAFMRDTDGNPRTPRDPITNLPNLGRTDYGTFRAASSTVDTVNREWKSALGTFLLPVWTLKTPHVLEYAKTHFNCPTLDGVDLENEGGSGTAISHFEKRIGNNDLMTGSIEQTLVPSPLTLSFFQDTGWYNVDMSKAADWKWGKGLGCTFVQKSCYEFMESRTREESMRPWCAEPPAGQTECLSYDNAFGQCDLRMYSSMLEAKYQYFRQLPNVPTSTVPYYGGKHSLMDRCPFIR